MSFLSSAQVRARLISAGLVSMGLLGLSGCDPSAGTSTTKAVATRVAADVETTTPAPAEATATSAPEKSTATETVRAVPAKVDGPVRDVTFDTIKLAIEKDQPVEASMYTPQVKQLEGQRIRIRGYMLPSVRQSGIRSFVLVRDNMLCCFGPGAALHDCIRVEMTAGNSAEFSVLPIAVEGTFSLREYLDPVDDRQLAIYHLEATTVK